MADPVLLVVDHDPDALGGVESELPDRYARHYRVRAAASASEALAALEELAAASEDVALVLAGQWLSGLTGSELLERVRRLHPQAKRCLLISWGGWGDPATGEAIFQSMARGHIDHYLVRPANPPDELFHQAVSGLLLDWAEARRRFPFSVKVVGAEWSGRAHELREVLGRCAVPAHVHARRLEGRARRRLGGSAGRRTSRSS